MCDLIHTYGLQRETLLDMMDCVILGTAEKVDATLVTFDWELLEHGTVSPKDVLEDLDDLFSVRLIRSSRSRTISEEF